MIQHVMLFWFRDDADPAVVDEVLAGIADFDRIPSVAGVAVSANRGDPERSAPYTHAGILRFRGLAERDAFFVDDRHLAVRELAMTVFGDLRTISVESPGAA
jgi:hypothetical protein